MPKPSKTKAKKRKPAKGSRIVSVGQPKAIGRPTKLTKDKIETAKRAIMMLFTDEKVCILLGVDPATFYRWKHANPDFREAVTRTKEQADQVIETAMHVRAQGYSVEAVRIFMTKEVIETVLKNGRRKITTKSVPVKVPYLEHIPADVVAQKIWLTNRAADRWRERGNEPPPPPPISDDEAHERAAASRRLLKMIEDNARAGGEPVFASNKKLLTLPAPGKVESK